MTDTRISLPVPCQESWEAMSPDGGNRYCERCSTSVVNLEMLTASRIKALLRQPGKVCVRAQLNERGEVKVRPDRRGGKLLAVVGAGVSLLASTNLAAQTKEPTGTIVGTVVNGDSDTVVEARSADGRVYKAKAKANGRFKFKRLPAGTYELSYAAYCGDPPNWDGDTVVVEGGKITKTTTTENYSCIVVGVIELQGDNG